VWTQKEVSKSRKQVAPLLRDAMGWKMKWNEEGSNNMHICRSVYYP
jgi:hypothetical protein